MKFSLLGCSIYPIYTYLNVILHRVEGRTWYTPYRGKLWIASTGLRISRQDADIQETSYRFIKGGKIGISRVKLKCGRRNATEFVIFSDIKFPADYPPGCLLGCVDLVDCLTQEQYRSQYPNGEVEDPYVFICENPVSLPVRYPVKGKPNICKDFALLFVVFNCRREKHM